jgi:hypothetical protein
MSFITNTGLRSLSYATFAVPEDGAVFKKIPGTNQDGSTGGVEKQVTARVDDTLRMSRLLVGDFRKKDDLVVTDPQTEAVIDVVERNRGTNSRTQAGNKFLANLALINQQATLAKIQKKDFTGLGSTVLDGAKDIAKTVASTLAQVPVAGTGVHFVNGGKVGKEYLKGGGNAVGNFLRNLTGVGGGVQGHELILSGDKIEINRKAFDSDPDIEKQEDQKYPNSLDNRLRYSKNKFVEQTDTTFRDKLTDGGREAVNTRLISTGTQNAKGRELGISVDQLNASDIRTGNPDTDSGTFFKNADIIPFEFQILNPEDGGRVKYLYFRAYLDSFEDNYASGWNTTKYIGRAENLYNYTEFNRSISFSFKLAAHTREELSPLYKKLNYLVGTTAPSYNENRSFMRGVYCKVTIGDYLSTVPGFFENISLTWDTNYPWELGLENDISPVPVVPHLLNVNMSFKPIHNFNPTLGASFITRDEFTQQEYRASNPIPPANVEPENLGALENPAQLDLTQDTLAFPFAVQPSNEEVPKVTLNSLNNVPQRQLTKVPTTAAPTQPRSFGTNTVQPRRVQLESNPFGG